jgi:hypothetical protein
MLMTPSSFFSSLSYLLIKSQENRQYEYVLGNYQKKIKNVLMCVCSCTGLCISITVKQCEGSLSLEVCLLLIVNTLGPLNIS